MSTDCPTFKRVYSGCRLQQTRFSLQHLDQWHIDLGAARISCGFGKVLFAQSPASTCWLVWTKSKNDIHTFITNVCVLTCNQFPTSDCVLPQNEQCFCPWGCSDIFTPILKVFKTYGRLITLRPTKPYFLRLRCHKSYHGRYHVQLFHSLDHCALPLNGFKRSLINRISRAWISISDADHETT